MTHTSVLRMAVPPSSTPTISKPSFPLISSNLCASKESSNLSLIAKNISPARRQPANRSFKSKRSRLALHSTAPSAGSGSAPHADSLTSISPARSGLVCYKMES